MRRIGVLSLLTFALVAMFHPTPAAAIAGAGIHAGATVDPDDFLIGLHWKSRPVAENISIVPSFEVGFGDVTMVAGNIDGHFDFPGESRWNPYVGGGVTLNWFDFDGGSDTEFGGSVLGGVTLNQQWFFETKLGLGDVPDWKFYVGARMPSAQ
jgi:opacity protein-like surface antigen